MKHHHVICLQTNSAIVTTQQEMHRYMGDLILENNADETTWSSDMTFSEDLDIVYETEFAQHDVFEAFGLEYNNRQGTTDKVVLAGVAFLIPKHGESWNIAQCEAIVRRLKVNGKADRELFTNVSITE